MGYLALYRQWRPKTFAEMVGQEHVTKTFVNALKREQIAHAYLFSGPRGTGKTTAAKILAKALNCQQRDGAEPCNQCPSCLSIDQGVAMEVLEIDAASNRGIDEMRDLREKVKLSAGQDRYKVYIIDEVHMLTTEAFNALLKTLEEPPPKVVFILATTEAHKIPPTILSRVQRFEFHRIRQEDIQTRLAEVCEALKRSVEPEALAVIAMKAEGGLRDALSILDQCLILDDDLDVAQVYQVLGMVGETYSADLADALLTGDYARVLEILEEGVRLGCDPRQIMLELLEYLRQMLLSLTSGRPPQVEPGLRERVIQQGKQAGISRLLGWLDV
ncbi:MAG: DNA polymerase III subunit gamma/tau, partial [Peptococcaceae bacterium]|nr:DNA polymerase III subunit gamma/tau [Peptococcaceae bacterium]